MIAGMTEEELYDRLREGLPHGETRAYLVKVVDRMPLYEEWK